MALARQAVKDARWANWIALWALVIAAISLIVAGRSLSRRRIARRVGSASAEKIRSSSADRNCSTIRLNIRQAGSICQMAFC